MNQKLTEEEFYALIKPGLIVQFCRGREPIRHIRAIVDEEEVVFRTWNKHKQQWNYEVENWYSLWCAYELGILVIKGFDNDDPTCSPAVPQHT